MQGHLAHVFKSFFFSQSFFNDTANNANAGVAGRICSIVAGIGVENESRTIGIEDRIRSPLV
jgi:hypothetical protein